MFLKKNTKEGNWLKKAGLLLLVGLLVLLVSSLALANLNSFVGQWVNTDPNTRGITALDIRINGTQINVRAFGKAHPNDIDWGTVPGYAYAGSVSENLFNGAQVVSAIYQTNFSETILLIRMQGANRLNVETLTRFTDGSQRANYHAYYNFKRDNSNSGYGILPPPLQIGPPKGKVFNHYPRQTKLIWQPVQGAQSYTVEVDYFDSDWITNRGETYILAPNLYQTSFNFEFVGAQPGRWRVWAVDANGQAGRKSPWWEFKYTR